MNKGSTVVGTEPIVTTTTHVRRVIPPVDTISSYNGDYLGCVGMGVT